MVQAGQYVTDGTAVFLVTDIRDGSQVGDIKLSPILRPGYVKANGALLTSARTNYPRLVQFITDNPSLNAADDTEWNSNKALYVYNSSADTLRVPDATGRVLQGGSTVKTEEAGLPNIKGTMSATILQGAGQGYGQNLPIDGTGAMSGINPSTGNRIYVNGAGNNSGTYYTVLDFDASRSSSIYSDSVNTVQPPSIKLIPQIKY